MTHIRNDKVKDIIRDIQNGEDINPVRYAKKYKCSIQTAKRYIDEAKVLLEEESEGKEHEEDYGQINKKMQEDINFKEKFDEFKVLFTSLAVIITLTYFISLYNNSILLRNISIIAGIICLLFMVHKGIKLRS